MSQTILARTFLAATLSLSVLATAGCSSSPVVKAQAYAPLRSERDFEWEFRPTWNAIEASLRNLKVTERDPEEVEELDWNKLTRRTIRTDWIYSQSRDKYQEYRVNDLPRRKYLQVRYKYFIQADRTMAGTHVGVKIDEEIEKLNSDGTSDGYSATEPDPARASEVLDKIQISLNSAHP